MKKKKEEEEEGRTRKMEEEEKEVERNLLFQSFLLLTWQSLCYFAGVGVPSHCLHKYSVDQGSVLQIGKLKMK